MKSKLTKYSIFALLFPILMVAIACTSSDSEPEPEPTTQPTQAPEQLSVMTTIYPMTYFSQRIGGDRVSVESLIKAGVDAHDFEPTPRDIISIGEADVLVYNHPAFESWVEAAIGAAQNETLVVVKAADIADDAVLAHDHGDEHDEHDEHDKHDDHDEHGDKEAELVEKLFHVVEEVEHEDISADNGVVEIEAILHTFEGAHEGHDEHEGHEDEGHKDEEHEDKDHEAHEDEDHEGHEDEHGEGEHLDELIEELEGIVGQIESGAISSEAGVEEIESVLGEHDHADHDEDEHGHDDHADHVEDEHGHDDHEEGVDAHVWLNPLDAVGQVRAIQAAFSDADPAGASTYAENADAVVAELTALDESFQAELSTCDFDHIIVSHLAYGHLAERYGIEQIGLQGLSTEGDARPQRVAQIVDAIAELGVGHVLQEPIDGSALVDTVAAETGAEILPLHPMESLTPAELEGGATYFSIMNQNLESLRTALQCG